MTTALVRKMVQLAAVVLLGMSGVAVVRGAGPEPAPRDALVYKDGDRVLGKFVAREGDIIVFKSDRFGELRVPAANAVVVMAEKTLEVSKPAAAVAAGDASKPGTEAKAAADRADRADVERLKIWEWFSPAVLTAKVRNYFGPWHGRFAFSTELVSDSADRSDLALEGLMKRKWKADELQLTARYDYAETNDLVTTDLLKASGSYRHDFSHGRFALYRPSLEWNRATTLNGVPNHYLLLQEEVGGGFNLLAQPSRTIRAGLSENLFNVWNTAPPGSHTSRASASVFEEAELLLPWRMSISQRGVWYVPLGDERDGWENRIELNKKLTETLSVAVRHEIRRHSPDSSVQDYTRLKLLLGLDF